MGLRDKICAVGLLFVFNIFGVFAQGLGQYTKSNNGSLDAIKFAVDFSEPVAMRITATAHYEIDTDDGDEEWSRILPSGTAGHLVNVRSEDDSTIRNYTVALFHQLKCLDIIRRQYVLLLKDQPELEPHTQERDDFANGIRPLAKHCMEYLRQALHCRPNLWLESTKDAGGTASRAYDAVCRDWTQVYAEAAANRKSFDDLVQNQI